MTSSLKDEASFYLSLVDLTSLGLEDTTDQIQTLCRAAVAPPTAAVCIYPKWVKTAKDALASSSVRVATVINFPHGDRSAHECAEAISQAKADGADEIDFVIDWRKFKASEDEVALKAYVQAMVTLIKPCTSKVILETSELSPELIRKAARACIECGVDFLKTSTGKVVGGGATVEAVSIFAQEIKASGAHVGIKPAGGIKTLEDCRALYRAAVDVLGEAALKGKFRIGASGVRNTLVAIVKAAEGTAKGAVEAIRDETKENFGY